MSDPFTDSRFSLRGVGMRITFKEVEVGKQDVENPPYIRVIITGEDAEVEVGRMLKETAETVKKRIKEIIKDYLNGRGDLGTLMKGLYDVMEDVAVEEGWSEWFINTQVSTDIDDYTHEVNIHLYLK